MVPLSSGLRRRFLPMINIETRPVRARRIPADRRVELAATVASILRHGFTRADAQLVLERVYELSTRQALDVAREGASLWAAKLMLTAGKGQPIDEKTDPATIRNLVKMARDARDRAA